MTDPFSTGSDSPGWPGNPPPAPGPIPPAPSWGAPPPPPPAYPPSYGWGPGAPAGPTPGGPASRPPTPAWKIIVPVTVVIVVLSLVAVVALVVHKGANSGSQDGFGPTATQAPSYDPQSADYPPAGYGPDSALKKGVLPLMIAKTVAPSDTQGAWRGVKDRDTRNVIPGLPPTCLASAPAPRSEYHRLFVDDSGGGTIVGHAAFGLMEFSTQADAAAFESQALSVDAGDCLGKADRAWVQGCTCATLFNESMQLMKPLEGVDVGWEWSATEFSSGGQCAHVVRTMLARKGNIVAVELTESCDPSYGLGLSRSLLQAQLVAGTTPPTKT